VSAGTRQTARFTVLRSQLEMRHLER
jgi:hypothetical protein